MYVKLVSSGSISALQAMRDVVRLVTSPSPNVAYLGGYSTTSSVVIDPTPAGWTYVGSNNPTDQPNLANYTTSNTFLFSTTSGVNYVVSSPTLSNNSVIKYAVLTSSCNSNNGIGVAGMGYCLSGASGATASGVLTNEGQRWWMQGTTSSLSNKIFPTYTSSTVHLIANPQHITMIYENTGLAAIWEASQTDAHTFYGTPPVVQYTHMLSANVTSVNSASPSPMGPTVGTNAAATPVVFNLTDPNTGTNYGTYDPSEKGNINIQSLFQGVLGTRTNSITANGLPAYQINPVYFSTTTKGYPTQFVTGVVPIYWCNAGLGNTGDTVTIGADTYLFFNCGSTNFGVLLKTS